MKLHRCDECGENATPGMVVVYQRPEYDDASKSFVSFTEDTLDLCVDCWKESLALAQMARGALAEGILATLDTPSNDDAPAKKDDDVELVVDAAGVVVGVAKTATDAPTDDEQLVVVEMRSEGAPPILTLGVMHIPNTERRVFATSVQKPTTVHAFALATRADVKVNPSELQVVRATVAAQEVAALFDGAKWNLVQPTHAPVGMPIAIEVHNVSGQSVDVSAIAIVVES